jgi:hypothetical protein
MENAATLFGHPFARYINVASRSVRPSKLPPIFPLTNPFIIVLYSSSLPSHHFPKLFSVSLSLSCCSPNVILGFIQSPISLPPSDDDGQSSLGAFTDWRVGSAYGSCGTDGFGKQERNAVVYRLSVESLCTILRTGSSIFLYQLFD